MLMRSYLFVFLVLCMLNWSQSRKTPAGRTPLGVSRSTSTKKPQLLAGPTIQPNPRAEQLEMAKEKLRRKISYQTKIGGEAPTTTTKKTKIPRPEKLRKDTSISDKSTIGNSRTRSIAKQRCEKNTTYTVIVILISQTTKVTNEARRR